MPKPNQTQSETAATYEIIVRGQKYLHLETCYIVYESNK